MPKLQKPTVHKRKTSGAKEKSKKKERKGFQVTPEFVIAAAILLIAVVLGGYLVKRLLIQSPAAEYRLAVSDATGKSSSVDVKPWAGNDAIADSVGPLDNAQDAALETTARVLNEVMGGEVPELSDIIDEGSALPEEG